MPAKPRVYSESGYMHITARGNGKQILFEEKPDYLFFLHLLKKYSIETKVSICAFCLMENHVHLLIYDPEKNVSLFMKKLCVTYAGYFNRKYDRIGHLFQGRFGSKVIDDEDYLLTVFRYILNNPRESGINNAAEYPWSSYKSYGNPNSFVDTGIIQELLGSWQDYAEFISSKYEEDSELQVVKHNDEWHVMNIKVFNYKLISGAERF